MALSTPMLGALAFVADIAAAVTPTPSPTPTAPPPETVTPGFEGFLATAFVVVAVIVLIWDMLRRVRRTRYRSEIDAQLDAEQQAAGAVLASDVDDQAVDAADSTTADADGEVDPDQGRPSGR